MIRLKGFKDCKHAKAVRSFARWANRELKIEHEIHVEYVPKVYGLFSGPDRPIDKAEDWFEILIIREDDMVLTLAHELGHYEQWRGDRKLTEHSREWRAQRLVDRWAEECGWKNRK